MNKGWAFIIPAFFVFVGGNKYLQLIVKGAKEIRQVSRISVKSRQFLMNEEGGEEDK